VVERNPDVLVKEGSGSMKSRQSKNPPQHSDSGLTLRLRVSAASSLSLNVGQGGSSFVTIDREDVGGVGAVKDMLGDTDETEGCDV
jgi:hypothetical protein